MTIQIKKTNFLQSFWKEKIENQCLKPYKFPYAVELRDAQLMQPWTESQISFEGDQLTYTQLVPKEKDRLNRALTFFTQTDVNIQNNQIDVLNDLFKGNSELRGMLSAFSAIESVHVGSYSKFIEMMTRFEHDFEEFKSVPIFKQLNEDATNIIEDYNKIECLYDLVYFIMKNYIIPEGAFLFTFFCILSTYGKNGFSGLSEIIRYSMSDELIHVKALRTLLIDLCGADAHQIMKRVSEQLKEKCIMENDDVLDYIYNDSFFNHGKSIYGLHKSIVGKYFEYNYNNVTLLFPPSTDNPIPEMVTMASDERDIFGDKTTTYNVLR